MLQYPLILRYPVVNVACFLAVFWRADVYLHNVKI